MSEREKEIIEKIAENLRCMDEEDKTILVEKADSMAYMNRKWKKKIREKTNGSSKGGGDIDAEEGLSGACDDKKRTPSYSE